MTNHTFLEGVLPDHKILDLMDSNLIQCANKKHVQPASIDVLPDLNHLYEVDYFYLPYGNGEKVESIITALSHLGKARKAKTPFLKKRKRYLVRLVETFEDLPYFAKMNPKSSPGRTFLHSRMVTDGHGSYDEFYPSSMKRHHWMFISPKWFNTELSEYEPITQIRFFEGNARLSSGQLRRELSRRQFLHIPNEAPLFEQLHPEVFGGGVGSNQLTVDLRSDIVAYKTKHTDQSIILSKRDHSSNDFFDVINKDQLLDGGLLLEEGAGYLLGSFERISLSIDIAAEVIPISEKYGDQRSHFAGFVDPIFGAGAPGGNSITLEMMSYEKGMFIRHRQPLADIVYEYMAAPPNKGYAGNYVVQPGGPKLPKYFG